jgi:CHAT domain-containing protein
MQRFYENRWERHLSTLESLREAQLWMLNGKLDTPSGKDARQYTFADIPQTARTKDGRVSPYYWAAFVLSGDWR